MTEQEKYIDYLLAVIRKKNSLIQIFMDRYRELVECGDCGFWKVENDETYIAAKNALKDDI